LMAGICGNAAGCSPAKPARTPLSCTVVYLHINVRLTHAYIAKCIFFGWVKVR
jgi:hypothetical protein